MTTLVLSGALRPARIVPAMRERFLNRTTLDVLLVILLIVWAFQPTLF